MSITVPEGRLLIKELEVENKTSGGIILTGNTDPENKARLGEIVYNGVLVNNKPKELYKEGNKVFFGKFSGATVQHGSDKYISIIESEVVAIVQ